MNKQPKQCNLCGSKVVYITNDKIYGFKYGSGEAYLCTECKAYVGTHKPRPREALGILSNEEMRNLKIKCHDIFDSMWRTGKERKDLYEKLASELHIPVRECHFGYFDLERLKRAYEIVRGWKKARRKRNGRT